MYGTRGASRAMRYDELTQPAIEPVSLAEVKTHRRIDSDDTSQDTLIPLLIATARRYAEQYTGRSFIVRSWRATADRFPGVLVPPVPFGAFVRYRPEVEDSQLVELDHGPVVSVDAISYLDLTGARQTLDPTLYFADLSGGRARIAPAVGSSWPATQAQIGAVRVDFTAGYSDTEDGVPEQLRHWMLVRIGTIFENREEVAVIAKGRLEAAPIIDSLLEFDREVVI